MPIYKNKGVANTLHQPLAGQMAELMVLLLDHCRMHHKKLANSLGLTVAEFRALRSFKDDSCVTAGELAKRVRLSNSRLTRILDGLVRKQLVHREHAASDRRVQELIFTEKGKRVHGELKRMEEQAHGDILTLLPHGAATHVVTSMEALLHAMERWKKD